MNGNKLLSESGPDFAGSPNNSTGQHFRSFRDSFAVVAIAWIAGLACGQFDISAHLLLPTSIIAVIASITLRIVGLYRLSFVLICSVSFCSGMGWWGISTRYMPRDDIGRFVSADEHLVEIHGRVEHGPYRTGKPSDPLSQWSYWSPKTYFILNVDHVVVQGEKKAMRGRVFVSASGIDDRIHVGQRLECAGWISQIEAPTNLGERDFQRSMNRQGVRARLRINAAHQIRIAEAGVSEDAGFWGHGSDSGGISGLRAAISGHVERLLFSGIDTDRNASHVELIQAMLLGVRVSSFEDDIQVTYRRVGVAHLLAISGLHLAVLAFFVWIVLLTITGRPNVAAAWVVVIVVLYVFILPARVPIVRAGVMTCVMALTNMFGRPTSNTPLLCLTAVILLLIDPTELYNPGFQLSFAVVAGLLRYAKPLALYVMPSDPEVVESIPRSLFRQWVVETSCACVVAWIISFPLIAYHFGLVSPYAAPATVLLMPFVFAILIIGFSKVVLSAVSDSAGNIVGECMIWFTDWAVEIPQWIESIPMSSFDVNHVSAAWVAITLIAGIQLLNGGLRRQPARVSIAFLLCCVWLAVQSAIDGRPISLNSDQRVVFRIAMVDVGGGECVIVHDNENCIVFDCGSTTRTNVGRRLVDPILRELGIRKVDSVVITRASVDRFNGIPGLADRVPIGSVAINESVLPDEMLSDAYRLGMVIDRLLNRQILTQGIGRDWTTPWNGRVIGMADAPNHAVAIRLEVAGKRVVISGLDELPAETTNSQPPDILILPDEPAFDDRLNGWVSGSSRTIVLSSLSRRARERIVPDHPNPPNVARYDTATHGMIRIAIHANGEITVQTFVESKN